jgi:hypothetical protein
VVGEGGRFACGQFVFAHKQMDDDAQSGVADDLLAALAATHCVAQTPALFVLISY